MSDHATRITKAAQARKLIGQTVKHWPLGWGSGWARNDILHEVAGKNVRLGHDWQWLPDIWMEPLPPAVEGEP